MTTFTPDRPDWTKEDTASIFYQQEQTIVAGDQFDFGLIGAGSYTVLAIGTTPNEPVLLRLLYQLSHAAPIPINEFAVTAQDDPAAPSLLVYESPSYGGLITIINFSTTADVLVNVFTSNRVIASPRIMTDLTPGRTFQYTGALLIGVAVNLPWVDGGPGGYAANVNAGYQISSNTAGAVLFYYRDNSGAQQQILIATLMANDLVHDIVALPQCVGQFWFVPTADEPGGAVQVLAYPARTA